MLSHTHCSLEMEYILTRCWAPGFIGSNSNTSSIDMSMLCYFFFLLLKELTLLTDYKGLFNKVTRCNSEFSLLTSFSLVWYKTINVKHSVKIEFINLTLSNIRKYEVIKMFFIKCFRKKTKFLYPESLKIYFLHPSIEKFRDNMLWETSVPKLRCWGMIRSTVCISKKVSISVLDWSKMK